MAEDEIQNVKLSFTCSENWDNMSPTSNGRHCDKCNKTIHDFTNSKVEEFRAIMAENNNGICGRFRKEQMPTVILRGWRKWVSAALVILGFNNMGCKDKPKSIPQNAPNNKQSVNTIDSNLVVGEIALDMPDTLPQYPGGNKAFEKFIKKHLSQTNTTITGRVIISFDINTEGSLSNYKIIRSINPAIDKQALNMVKKMPKWHPAIKHRKPVKYVNYAIPIVFQ